MTMSAPNVVYFCYVCQDNRMEPLPILNGMIVVCPACKTTYDVHVTYRDAGAGNHPVYAFTLLSPGTRKESE